MSQDPIYWMSTKTYAGPLFDRRCILAVKSNDPEFKKLIVLKSLYYYDSKTEMWFPTLSRIGDPIPGEKVVYWLALPVYLIEEGTDESAV